MSWRDGKDLARETGELWRYAKGIVRRLVVTLTDGARWQFVGQRGGAGGDEVLEVEPFTGIGFYSRPPATGNPEAIATAVGGAKHLVIVATRDEATRAIVAADLQPGETQIHSANCIVRVKDGRIEARSSSGNADPVLTMTDGQNIITALTNAINTLVAGATPAPELTALKAALLAVGFPNGTEVFKAE